MKTETKSKLFKALKVGAYVGGLMLALVLGMGFGSCSEKKMHYQTSQTVEPKQFKPKSLATGVNLLSLGSKYIGVGNYRISGENSVSLGGIGWVSYLFDKSAIPEGHSYVAVCDGSFSVSSSWRFIGAVSSVVAQKVSFSVPFENYDDSLVKWVTPDQVFSPLSFFVPLGTYTSGQGGASITKFCISLPASVEGVYLADDASWLSLVPSVADISFEKNGWFPYQIFGENNSPVIVGPFHATDDMTDKDVFVDDILFSSNGRLFNKINFNFVPVAIAGSVSAGQGYASVFGYYNPDMTPIGTPSVCNSNYLWYLNSVSYVPVNASNTNPVVFVGGQRLKQFDDSSKAITQYFDWVDERFSYISVKWAGSKVNTEITTTSGLTNLQWLENIASSVFDSSISLGGGSVDVFSLIGNGFSSITSILNVQILPYLTLGTLLLAPLVILLALAILKVLNK